MNNYTPLRVGLCVVVLLVLGLSIPTLASITPDTLQPTTSETSPYADDFRCYGRLRDGIAHYAHHFYYHKQWMSSSHDRILVHSSSIESRTSSKHDMKNSQRSTYDGKTLYVGGTGPGNYITIQMAIWAASDGDTVFVYAGTYRYRQWLSSLRINKSIQLLGENPESTIFIGKGYVQGRPVLEVTADDVTISGFTLIRDLPEWCILQDPRDCGIAIYGNNCVVSRNIFTKSVNGVMIGSLYYLPTLSLITVANNTFRDNSATGLIMCRATQSVIENNSFFGSGIWITGSYHNRYMNNTFNGKPLIVLEDTSDVSIQEAGQVILIGCTNITVVNTTIEGSYIGIWLQHSQQCTLIGNNLENCFDCGIMLEWSDNNIITDNVINNCYFGLLLGSSHYNRVQTNYIIGNIECPLFMSIVEQNIINRNIFDNNADFLSMFQGIYLTEGTRDNDITNNTLINDTLYIQNAVQNRIINNTVNGKPLIFLEGTSGNIIDYPVGQIILITCDNIEVRNQTDIVIHVFGCDDCLVENVSVRTNNYVGLFICDSQDINVTNCIFSKDGYGIRVRDSNHFIVQNNLFQKNIYVALGIQNSTDGSVVHNSFEENGGYTHPSLSPVFIHSSKSIEVQENNFIGNVKGAYFMMCQRKAIHWDGNFWDQPRVLPKVIPGFKLYLYQFNIDWHPAQEPYDIPGMS